jgi:hypothetical protein
VTPAFGVLPDRSAGFIDEIVWVCVEGFEGLGYCDNEGDEANEWIVYPGQALQGPYYLVQTDQMRLATKDETRIWHASQRRES